MNEQCRIEKAEYPEPRQDGWWKITPKGKPPVFFNRADVPPQHWDSVDPLRVGTIAIRNAIGAPSTRNDYMGTERPPRLQKLKTICIKITTGSGAQFEMPLYYQGFV